MASTRRSIGRVPDLSRAWLEVSPDMREFLNSVQQVVNDSGDEAGDVGSAIAFFMGSTFAGASGGWAGGAVGDGDKGDITVSSGGSVFTIDTDVVSNTKLADMAQSTVKGRAVGVGTGDPTDLTATQATAILDGMTGDSGAGGVKGLVPAPSAGDAASGKYLAAGGTWSVPVVATTVGTPAVITADQNDYDPGVGEIVRLRASAAWRITGILAGASGARRLWVNAGNFDITLGNQDALSAANNRLLCQGGGDIVLPPGFAADAFYDASNLRWRTYAR